METYKTSAHLELQDGTYLVYLEIDVAAVRLGTFPTREKVAEALRRSGNVALVVLPEQGLPVIIED